jgi:16S rRNA processing protein RimM
VIRSVRLQGERTVVAFDGIRDRNGAEALRGAELRISADDARELDDAEYWDHDLVNCEVVTADGEPVGTVSDVLHTPANSVLVVQGAREHLIPLVSGVVTRVEPGVRITIDPIPGLLGEA